MYIFGVIPISRNARSKGYASVILLDIVKLPSIEIVSIYNVINRV